MTDKVSISMDGETRAFINTLVRENSDAMQRLAEKFLGNSAPGAGRFNPTADRAPASDADLLASQKKKLKQLKDEIKAIKHKIAVNGKITRAELNDLAKKEANYKKLSSTIEDLTDETSLLNHSIRSTRKTLTGQFSQAIKDLASRMFKIGSLADGLSQTYSEAITSIATSTKYDIFGAIIKGLSIEEFLKLQKDQQAVIGSMTGGLNEYNKRINSQLIQPLTAAGHSIVSLTGNLPDATRFIAQSYDIAQSMGVAAKHANGMVANLSKDFAELGHLTKMTAAEFAAYQENIAKDSTIRDKLRKMNDQQRIAYLQDTSAFLKHAVAIGLSTEAAANMQKTLATFQGKDAIDRIREGVKIQGLAGSIGMGAEGAEFAQLFRLGDRANAEQTVRMQELGSIISTELEKQKGLSLRNELSINARQNALDPNGILKQLNTDLEQGKAQRAKELADGRQGPNTFLDKAVNLLSPLTALAKSGPAMIVAAIGVNGLILSKILAAITFGKAGGMLGRGARKIGGAIKTGTLAAGGVIKTGTLAAGGAIASGARSIGSSVGNIAKAAPKTGIANAAAQVGKLGLGRVIPALLGGPVGWAIGLGTVGYEVYKHRDKIKKFASGMMPTSDPQEARNVNRRGRPIKTQETTSSDSTATTVERATQEARQFQTSLLNANSLLVKEIQEMRKLMKTQNDYLAEGNQLAMSSVNVQHKIEKNSKGKALSAQPRSI